MADVRWASIPGYEGKYEISNTGCIRTAARDILDKDGSVITSLKPALVEVHGKDTKFAYSILHDGQKYKKVEIIQLVNSLFSK